MEVIGYRKAQFTAQDTGEVIQGYSLYLTSQEDDRVTGKSCERVFLSIKKLGGYEPELGDQLELVYNRYGKVDHVELLG